MVSLLKFGTHDCPLCQRMADFDSRVATALGLAFVNVDMKDPQVYGRYRKVLLQHYPLKHELHLPTYLLVDDPEGAFSIHGEVVGPCSEAEFKTRLQALLSSEESTGD
jgi:thiol-disulfide isomerase/thioredoxin